MIANCLGRVYENSINGKYIVPYCTAPDQMGDRVETTARNMFEDVKVQVDSQQIAATAVRL